MARLLPAITPGELLYYEFMEPLQTKPADLAEQTGIAFDELIAVLSGKGCITEEVDQRLTKHFKLSTGYFLRAQTRYLQTLSKLPSEQDE